ncbi:MAG: DUF2116 family Zn-ribbon domain-containing protein [Candidatus Methanomethylophilaceae archaeon]|nr:DUF2116 family Zn-ribbon domain-containing protein [Candidatus Methanomethylophilaceae archaeon]
MVGGIRLPEHSHCQYCGDPIPFGEEYCNDECKRKDALEEAAAKRKDYMFYGIAIATVVAILAIGYLFRYRPPCRHRAPSSNPHLYQPRSYRPPR